jgi:hypothetical protein
VSDDDIAQLRRMRDHGEITDAQYDVLRRHVLWGTPLPEAVESLAADDAPPRPGPAATPRHPGPAAPPAYTGPPSGSFPAYTGPPSGGFPAVPPYTGPPSGSVPHYTGPPSGSFPALGHPTGGQPGIPPQQTGWPSGQVPQIPPASTPGWGSESWWQAEQSQGADRQGAGHHRAAPPARPVPEVPGKAEPRSRWRRGRPAFLLSLVLVVAVIGAGAWWRRPSTPARCAPRYRAGTTT